MQADATHSSSAEDCFPSARQLFVCLLIYFGLHIVLRVIVSSTVDLDEAEQFVLSQKLSLGYGPQPPLYAWVQMGFFKIFGVTIFALALWKFILLFATHALTYFNARFITRSHACGVAAVASLFLFHQIAWESVRDLTHSVLASTLAAATLLTLMRVQQKRSLAAYALFGVCAGLGTLSKYNYFIALACLLLAGVSLRDYRSAILNWRFALALVIALLIFLPNGFWMLEHRDLALSSADKFQVKESGSNWLESKLIGSTNILFALLTYAGLFVGVLAALFWRRNKPAPRLHTIHERLLLRMLILLGVGLVVLLLFFPVTGFRDRWFLSLLINMPVLVIAMFRDRVDRIFLKRLLAVTGVVMLMVLTMVPARVFYSERFDFLTHLNNPYDALSIELREPLESVSTVVCDDRLTAGNLVVLIPRKVFLPLEAVPVFAPDTSRFALVWDATRNKTPPQKVVKFATSLGIEDIEAFSPRFVEAPFKHWQDKKMRLGFVIVDRTKTDASQK